MGEPILAAGSRPEIELFDSGDITLLKALQKAGSLPKAPLCSIIIGVHYGFEPWPGRRCFMLGAVAAGSAMDGFRHRAVGLSHGGAVCPRRRSYADRLGGRRQA